MIAAEKQTQAKALGMTLIENVREYFKDEQHRAEFAEWYEKEYGKPYVWKELNL